MRSRSCGSWARGRTRTPATASGRPDRGVSGPSSAAIRGGSRARSASAPVPATSTGRSSSRRPRRACGWSTSRSTSRVCTRSRAAGPRRGCGRVTPSTSSSTTCPYPTTRWSGPPTATSRARVSGGAAGEWPRCGSAARRACSTTCSRSSAPTNTGSRTWARCTPSCRRSTRCSCAPPRRSTPTRPTRTAPPCGRPGPRPNTCAARARPGAARGRRRGPRQLGHAGPAARRPAGLHPPAPR